MHKIRLEISFFCLGFYKHQENTHRNVDGNEESTNDNGKSNVREKSFDEVAIRQEQDDADIVVHFLVRVDKRFIQYTNQSVCISITLLPINYAVADA